MAAFSKIKVGDTLWDCRKTVMGNTTMRRMSCWTVRVMEINEEKKQALCSWNGNRAEWWSERRLSHLRRTRADTKS